MNRLLKDLRTSELDRRKFLALTSAGAVAAVFGFGPYTSREAADLTFASDPFTLGVASGDPLPDGVVLWTRLAPDPLAEGGAGGMPYEKVAVRWEISEYENFRKLTKTGTAFAHPELAHSVHVEATGLRPDRWYFYRFRVGREVSPVGRTKTAPAPGANNSRLNFAFASCQAYPDGFWTAYEHMASEDLDLVVHLGDYIYEYGIPTHGGRRNQPGSVPIYFAGETITLDRYRLQHALYKSDPNLQAVHRNFPWIVTWDDHEVENNYAAGIPEASSQTPNPADFLVRRANAYRAYYEHMPLRRTSMPQGPDMQLYRRLRYGNLAEFNVLDTRQFRSDQAAGDGTDPPNPESLDPARTITGAEQERWLLDGLAASQATWNVLANQVIMAQRDVADGYAKAYSMDQWDGYVGSRDRVLGFITQQQIRNPVVITGDVHSNWAANLKANFDDPASRTIGVELIGTSISSGGDGSDTSAGGELALRQNPHYKFFNGQRGYVKCAVTPELWKADYRVVPFVYEQGAPISTRRSFVTEAGNPGLEDA
ncbi:alkaline phosphatase D family protein [Tenggerimyces flavus]|uniref:Alkaline phosphatase D family protein n=1 Tax=Tenggerimyces flavus TaxID=1708749 RepID=A0ABV7YAR3_9ACTN|nr:alkaline phosphatase D family protein [Tenggerimyces flavus]MBM7786892.1 alkaline phosphatase D [Tenggerimyces flavus]